MPDLSVEVDMAEVEGDSLPFKTSETVVDLLKSDVQDNVTVNLLFPAGSGKKIGEEGILGWYRPRTYHAENNGNSEFSKIIFLQEKLKYAGYSISAINELDTYKIVLNCRRIGSTAQLNKAIAG